MAVTARDVARVAGVSVSTVSRALAKPDEVAPETRAKVLATAQGMGYRPNQAARGLVTGRTGIIGLIVPDLENPFFASVTKGVQSRARAAGFAVIVADSDEDPSQEAELARDMSKQVDGLVLCAPRGPEGVIVEVALDIPMVLINRRCGDLPTVAIDNVEGIRLAMVHLRALGHRRIAWVGGPVTSWSNTERLSALESVAAEHPDIELVNLGSFPPYVSGGIAAADLVIASGATAVLAYNDLLAFGLLDLLRQRGVAVPGDISVVGVDNIPMSSLTSPSLTSVGIPLVTCGRASVDMLVQLVRDPSAVPAHHHDLSFRLVVRDSSGPVRRVLADLATA
ncbi:LacI family DNA-binding transcriptional regulator [Cellulomonas sp. Leaf395]|uniref:LacI family DNA-binding transcriptional regulator n=1 Tax=Cellulomonas sp. Leaf395 TaxID=1736362 RepID=UPI0006F89DD9|nr:LacI family DNA-binding transcriptional regulator [Cellulomonas sp. Leaf395]KQT02585.1 LacI family transcriptional regulator [Cellulomonas sp. Leaf395]